MTQTRLRFFKVDALPDVPEPDSVYYVKARRDQFVTEYVTEADGTAVLVDSTGNTGPGQIANAPAWRGVISPDLTTTVLFNSVGGDIVVSAFDTGLYDLTIAGAFPDDLRIIANVQFGLTSTAWAAQIGRLNDDTLRLNTFYILAGSPINVDIDAPVRVSIEIFP